MIVVVIIGMLAVIAVPTWQKIRLNAQNKRILNSLRQLNAAAQQYFLERGVNSVQSAALVGPETDKYITHIATVRGETYPAVINATDPRIDLASDPRNPGDPVYLDL